MVNAHVELNAQTHDNTTDHACIDVNEQQLLENRVREQLSIESQVITQVLNATGYTNVPESDVYIQDCAQDSGQCHDMHPATHNNTISSHTASPLKRKAPSSDPSKRKCNHCSTTKSAGKWRRDRDVMDQYLCNKCGMNQRRMQIRYRPRNLDKKPQN